MDIDEKKVDTLIRKYELHKKELLLQIDLYNRQTKYIQVYGAFLLGLLAFLLGLYPGQKSKPALPTELLFIILTFGSIVAFYLVSTIMVSTYIILIIRRQMAKIEDKLNTLLNEPGLLFYETKVTPHFLENILYGKWLFTPYALSGFWRVALFISVIFSLVWIAVDLLPTIELKWLYSVVIISCSYFQVRQYLTLYPEKEGIIAIEKFYLDLNEYKYHKWLFLVPIVLTIITIFIIAIIIFSNPLVVIENLNKSVYKYLLFQNSNLLLLYIFIYEVLCAIFLSTFSEAPLLLVKAPLLYVPKFHLFTILIVSALGKGFGAWIVCRWWNIINKFIKMFHFSRFFPPNTWIGNRFIRLKNRIEDILNKWGFRAYLVMQSIPFFGPMRSSIYLYSSISRNGAKVAIGAAIGSVLRNLLMLVLILLGYVSIKTLLLK